MTVNLTELTESEKLAAMDPQIRNIYLAKKQCIDADGNIIDNNGRCVFEGFDPENNNLMRGRQIDDLMARQDLINPNRQFATYKEAQDYIDKQEYPGWFRVAINGHGYEPSTYHPILIEAGILEREGHSWREFFHRLLWFQQAE